MTDSNKKGFAGTIGDKVETAAYFLGISLYEAGVKLASGFNEKAKLMCRGRRNLLSEGLKKYDFSGYPIWIHCASLGEFEQARPLIERLKAERPDIKVVVTFFSPSGYEVRKNYPLADAVLYLPFDTPGKASAFLRMVNPRLAVFTKYEIWRGYLRALQDLQVPALLISANFRANQLFFKKRGRWYADWLRMFIRIFVQTPESKRLLEGIGITDVEVAGDTRFDRVARICSEAAPVPVLDAFVGRKGSPEHTAPVFIAGSSWPADEAVYADWLNARNFVKAIIAPHEFDAARLVKLKELFNGEAVLKSEAEADPELLKKARVVIIDCFGILSSAYAYGDVAYVGGGFGVGIHNINEAAAFSIPVLYGPNHSKFVEAEELKTLGGGLAVSGKDGFGKIADKLFFDPAERERRGRWAGEYILEKTGATDKIWNFLVENSLL